MLKIFDKAQWHIDAGEEEGTVIARLEAVFKFLDKNGLLRAEGKEIYQLGIDSSVSLHERMVTGSGNAFLEKNYDSVMNLADGDIFEALESRYKEFIS